MTTPELGALLPVIDTMLEGDLTGPVKQRHTAKRIFERVREVHDFSGGYTLAKGYVRQCRQATAGPLCRWRHRWGMTRWILAKPSQ